MTDNIIDFSNPKQPEAPIFTYVFTDKGNEEFKVKGTLSFNPLFLSVADKDNQTIFLLPFERLAFMRRIDD